MYLPCIFLPLPIMPGKSCTRRLSEAGSPGGGTSINIPFVLCDVACVLWERRALRIYGGPDSLISNGSKNFSP